MGGRAAEEERGERNGGVPCVARGLVALPLSLSLSSRVVSCRHKHTKKKGRRRGGLRLEKMMKRSPVAVGRKEETKAATPSLSLFLYLFIIYIIICSCSFRFICFAVLLAPVFLFFFYYYIWGLAVY